MRSAGVDGRWVLLDWIRPVPTPPTQSLPSGSVGLFVGWSPRQDPVLRWYPVLRWHPVPSSHADDYSIKVE